MELLAVIVIISIVAALTYPAWQNSKVQAAERVTESNLHQAFIAVELYRQDYDGGGSTFGSSSALGLPNREGFVSLLKKSGIVWWIGKDIYGYGPIYYPWDKSEKTSDMTDEFWNSQMSAWLAYNKKYQGQSVMIGDFNHTLGCGVTPVYTCLMKGQGIQFDGSLRRREAVGSVFQPSWWENL